MYFIIGEKAGNKMSIAGQLKQYSLAIKSNEVLVYYFYTYCEIIRLQKSGVKCYIYDLYTIYCV